MRQLAFDVFAGPDKVLSIVVVLFDPGRHGKDIRVKDNVFRWEANLFGQNFVRAAADLNFALAGVSLTDLIEGHHHHGGTVAAHQLRVMNKWFDTLFHGDGVNDALALNALQAFLDHFPFRGVDHNRHAGNVRLPGDEIKETHHRRFGVEHPLIHVDINNLRAALNLLAGNVQRFAVFLFFDQALELRGAGHVGTFTHVHKQAVIADVQRLKSGQSAGNRQFGQLARGQACHRIAHGGDMLWRGAAAAADDIQEPGFGPFADLRRHRPGVEIVFTEGIRQTGVRVSSDVAFGDARQLLHILAQFVRPQRTVQAKAQGIGVAQGVVKRFRGLS